MCEVWKIGSRWGNYGPSVLDLFFEYGCVFFSLDGANRLGDWTNVKKGHLFVVADGDTPVAVGESLGRFKTYAETGVRFRKCDDNFKEDVVFCPARFALLGEEDRVGWRIEGRRRFCGAKKVENEVRQFWAKKNESLLSAPFEIKTRVASLLCRKDVPLREEDGLLQKDLVKYSIPIYQRPYSWGEQNLRRLMQDLHQGSCNKEPVFMGTVQLSQPIPLSPDGKKRSYDIIDGQQRLTTFLILLAILAKITGKGNIAFDFMKENFRTSVNKRAAQDDLDEFLEFFGKWQIDDDARLEDRTRNPYIDNAKTLLMLLKEFAGYVSEEEDEHDMDPAPGDLERYASDMQSFISNMVKVVVIETHAGLSKTIKIFNTINSSGLDLGSEDLFKVRFYEYLRKAGNGEEVFDQISEVYEDIENYNRAPAVNVILSMTSILSSYQRVLVARCGLGISHFAMSQETFFGRLFDTALGEHAWDGFDGFLNPISNDFWLTIDDLKKVARCHVDYLNACALNPDLRIARWMIFETRYPYAADFPVLAMVAGVASSETVEQFTRSLLKALVPPSIFYAKQVYYGRVCLFNLMKAMWNKDVLNADGVMPWCRGKWFFGGMSLLTMAKSALTGHQIAGNAKWKNLICRLIEYIKWNERKKPDDELFKLLFQTRFDIEHIQSYTDEKDRERVWGEWREELNKVGNLAMLESSLNRSVKNKQNDKTTAYTSSRYSIKELATAVGGWTKEDAVSRRERIVSAFEEFLSNDSLFCA